MTPLLALIIRNYGRFTSPDTTRVAAVFEISVRSVGLVCVWARMLMVLDHSHLNYDLPEPRKN
jgi:hypothetical protein